MTRPKIRITFEGAQSIFTGVQLEKVFLGGKLSGYKAVRNAQSLDSTSLGDLCTALWEVTDAKLRQYEEAEAEKLVGSSESLSN